MFLVVLEPDVRLSDTFGGLNTKTTDSSFGPALSYQKLSLVLRG
jgi:hypothetical protein